MIEEKTKIIPMTSDVMFKSVLLSKSARGYIIEVISKIANIKEEDIKDFEIRNNEHKLISVKERKKISDIIIDVKRHSICLEMNKYYYEGIINRNYDYIGKIKEGIIGVGEKYNNDKKVILINFDNYNLYKDDRSIIKFMMLDKERKIEEGVNIESYHIVLPNIEKKYYNKEKLSEIEKLLLVTCLKTEEEIKDISLKNENIKKVGVEIMKLSKEEELQGWYDYEEHHKKIENSMKYMGLKEGKKEGLKEGIEKGSLNAKKEMIKNMIKENISYDVISKIAKIDKDEIDNFLNS